VKSSDFFDPGVDRTAERDYRTLLRSAETHQPSVALPAPQGQPAATG